MICGYSTTDTSTVAGGGAALPQQRKDCFMKKIFATLISFGLLISLPALAENGSCQIDKLSSKLSPRTDLFVDPASEDESNLFFHQFAMALPVGTEIRFEIRHEDHLLLAEEVSLIEGSSGLGSEALAGAKFGGTVVEILSQAAAERSRLRHAASSEEINVSVWLDGELNEVLSISELVDRSTALRGNSIPHAILIRGAAEAEALELPMTKGACENSCYNQHDACYDNCVWVPNSGPCFDSCDDDLDECLLDCSGGCNPSTTTSAFGTLLSESPFGSPECIKPYGLNPRKRYQKYQLIVRVTTTTTTTLANCSQTVTTTISYDYPTCYKFHAPGWCSNPRNEHNICTH